MTLLRDTRTIVVNVPKVVFDRLRQLALARRASVSTEVVRLLIESLGRVDGAKAADAAIATLTEAARERRGRG